jgi:chitin disaccharide deacetylase
VKQLIVNADDFGLTVGVTQGILDAHRAGIVTSTTLMANGAAFDFAVTARRLTPALGVGVHLNLSEGIAVSPARGIPTLVDDGGRLHLTPGRLLAGLLRGGIDLEEVETELRAQISKAARAGISPTHLDAHKHVHVLPGVSDIVIRLAREFAIPSVRCPLEEPPAPLNALRAGKTGRVLKQYLVGRGVAGFASRFRQKLDQAGLEYAAHFYGLSYTGFLNTELVRGLLNWIPEGTSELMCHPGYPDASLAKTGTRLLAQREVEVFALCSPVVKSLTTGLGIQLVNYRVMAGRQSDEVAA